MSGRDLLGVLVVEKVVKIKRMGERLMVVKLVVGERLMNVISCYAPQSGRSQVEEE